MFSKDAKIKAANSQLDRGTLLRLSLRATRGARNPNLQVSLRMRRKYVASISFGLPLRMNGMHRTQFDHVCFDYLLLTHSDGAKAF